MNLSLFEGGLQLVIFFLLLHVSTIAVEPKEYITHQPRLNLMTTKYMKHQIKSKKISSKNWNLKIFKNKRIFADSRCLFF